MNTRNPFPGMNPFLEHYWLDVHTKLIAYISDAIAEQLPASLSARAEEKVILSEDGDERGVLADVGISESWRQGVPPRWMPGGDDAGGLLATEPKVAICEPETDRWVEIVDWRGTLITVIEVLSPVNRGREIIPYRNKVAAYRAAGVNVVEIDLLRAGGHAIGVSEDFVRKTPATTYVTCVTRAKDPARFEYYETALSEPLPVASIPLRAQDRDALLALQPLIDRSYRMGGYWNVDHTRPRGPVFSEEEQKWVASCVEAAGLSGGPKGD